MEQLETGSFTSSELIECPATIHVVSWNIACGAKLNAIIEFVATADADIVFLQEVDRNARRTNFLNVAKEIAQKLKMNYVFGCEFEELFRRDPGFACLPWSSYPFALATVRLLDSTIPQAIQFLAATLVRPQFPTPAEETRGPHSAVH